jgi:hypothetical protein
VGVTAKIRLVQGDNRPYITLTLSDSLGAPINLTDASVVMYFRAVGTTDVLATIICTVLDGGTSGKIVFNFPGATLNVPAGLYEGEISVTFGNETQTVYDVLKFQVREQFA